MVATHDVFTPFLVDASPFALYRLSMWVVYNVYVLGYNLQPQIQKRNISIQNIFLMFLFFVLFMCLFFLFC